jgi:prophage regulatory protein
MNTMTEAPQRFLSAAVVRARTSLSRSAIFRMARKGEFPKAIRLSRSRVGFREADIDQWMASRPDAE